MVRRRRMKKQSKRGTKERLNRVKIFETSIKFADDNERGIIDYANSIDGSIKNQKEFAEASALDDFREDRPFAIIKSVRTKEV